VDVHFVHSIAWRAGAAPVRVPRRASKHAGRRHGRCQCACASLLCGCVGARARQRRGCAARGTVRRRVCGCPRRMHALTCNPPPCIARRRTRTACPQGLPLPSWPLTRTRAAAASASCCRTCTKSELRPSLVPSLAPAPLSPRGQSLRRVCPPAYLAFVFAPSPTHTMCRRAAAPAWLCARQPAIPLQSARQP
jgi:hypothetical protein